MNAQKSTTPTSLMAPGGSRPLSWFRRPCMLYHRFFSKTKGISAGQVCRIGDLSTDRFLTSQYTTGDFLVSSQPSRTTHSQNTKGFNGYCLPSFKNRNIIVLNAIGLTRLEVRKVMSRYQTNK